MHECPSTESIFIHHCLLQKTTKKKKNIDNINATECCPHRTGPQCSYGQQSDNINRLKKHSCWLLTKHNSILSIFINDKLLWSFGIDLVWSFLCINIEKVEFSHLQRKWWPHVNNIGPTIVNKSNVIAIEPNANFLKW